MYFKFNDKKIISEPNPTLKIIRDNKPKWYLPETRREDIEIYTNK